MLHTLLSMMNLRAWRPRHYAAALWFALSFCLLTAADALPAWAVLLLVANFAAAARCATTIPLGNED